MSGGSTISGNVTIDNGIDGSTTNIYSGSSIGGDLSVKNKDGADSFYLQSGSGVACSART